MKTQKIDGVSSQPITASDVVALNANFRINRAVVPFVFVSENTNGTGTPHPEREVAYFDIFANIKEFETDEGSRTRVLFVEKQEEFDAVEDGIIGFPTLDERGDISDLELLRLGFLTDKYLEMGYITEEDLSQVGDQRLYIDIHTLIGHQIPFLVKRKGKLVGSFRFIASNITNRALYGLKGDSLLQFGELPIHDYISDDQRRRYGREEGLYWSYNPKTKRYTDTSKKGRLAFVGEISQFINIDSKITITLYMIEFLKKFGEAIRRTELGELLKRNRNRPAFSVLVSPELAAFLFNTATRKYAEMNNSVIFQLDADGDAPGSPVTPGVIVFNM